MRDLRHTDVALGEMQTALVQVQVKNWDYGLAKGEETSSIIGPTHLETISSFESQNKIMEFMRYFLRPPF